MLFLEPTLNNAGVEIWGTEKDCANFSSSFWELILPDTEEIAFWDTLIGLLKDFRLAAKGSSLQLETNDICGNKHVLFGTKETWPEYLFFLKALRYLMSISPTNREHHSNIFRLEHETQMLVSKIAPAFSAKLNIWLDAGIPFDQHFNTDYLSFITQRFIDLDNTDLRMLHLNKILAELSQYSSGYKEFVAHAENNPTEETDYPYWSGNFNW